MSISDITDEEYAKSVDDDKSKIAADGVLFSALSDYKNAVYINLCESKLGRITK